MSTNIKITAVIAAAMAAIVVAFSLLGGTDNASQPSGAPSGAAPAAQGLLIRADSHLLSKAPDSKVTLVEFLDFECEACGATFPNMERIRAEYSGQINVVVRYFPLPGHRNGELAAQVAEAAARQGKFEDMYAKLFQTQQEWGEATESKQAYFLSLAQSLGLDMAAFERDLAAPGTAERVKKDQDDGLALGVQATPTIFFNGVPLDVDPTYENLKSKIDAALAS
ncbi:hypothetical protein GCM10009555_071340 [Acrocarpospora macrocephala]|uniref:Thioredoxin domain-containing protein n=1 Tax=Acrocarpospora macrocephala TaxID=150177 RepID=A0A5M3WK13_9ACTN|nr:thioredoxin domain-containing protein [Acrocarpospora macrocephala]GES08720.1 hypothetical protein Amac_023160 [Acrocarpospora macrocephala]